MTETTQNADFRRKPQIFADSPLLLEIQAFGGRRKPQKTADFRSENHRFSPKTAGNRTLGSVTLGASPLARLLLLSIQGQSGNSGVVPGSQDRKSRPRKWAFLTDPREARQLKP